MTILLSALVASALTVAALWPFRWAALRLRIMDQPGPRKSHSEPVPYLGGLAMFVGLGISLVFFHRQMWAVAVLIAFVAVIGLVDDIRYIPVWAKLLGQVAIASSAVAMGVSWHFTDSAGLNAGASVLWIVGLTNSFNLLDNMDGLAATLAALTFVAVAMLVPSSAILAAPFAGAAIGFLVINRPPAKMYMGDTGSLMLGFGVALCTISAANSEHGLHSVVILVAPVAVALFDTSLVIVSRLATSRPIQLGGKDHFSHRLALMGWSPYQVLAAASAASVAAGAGAALALRYPLPEAWLALPVVLAFVVAWVRLLRVDPYAASAHHGLKVHRARGA